MRRFFKVWENVGVSPGFVPQFLKFVISRRCFELRAGSELRAVGFLVARNAYNSGIFAGGASRVNITF